MLIWGVCRFFHLCPYRAAPVTNLRVARVGKVAQLRWNAVSNGDYAVYRAWASKMSYRYLVTNPGFNDTLTHRVITSTVFIRVAWFTVNMPVEREYVYTTLPPDP